MKQIFVLCYSRGPAWIEGKAVFEQPLREHLAYMHELKARGVLLLGGPFTDDEGGLVVAKALSLNEARCLVERDPAVSAGVMVAVAHPWKLMAGAIV